MCVAGEDRQLNPEVVITNPGHIQAIVKVADTDVNSWFIQ